ncbi:enoyl-CoA hydratase/isomerase family protein [Sporobolomyces koalae]|uniref:enoyl-CoA hydratase/isomerase family protein n=1 Tax=Sporobolomyces koalae TaxID=500713 RepID=UPI0031794912
MASQRVSMVAQHLSSTSSASAPSAAPPSSSSTSTTTKGTPSIGDAPVLFEAEHSLRKVILNRPKALNSLNDEMVDLILPQLSKFEQSDLANVVLIKSNSKHFCAGGDVVSLTKSLAKESDWKNASGFFKKEYIMNHFLATMSKPVISLMNGVAFGGGLGLSMHGAFRVATETTQVAMPETKIGLFPDVGANFFLPRLDGQLGIYLALTSVPLKGAGAYFAGFTSHYVPSERLAALENRLAELEATATVEDVNAAINEFSADADELKLALESYPLVGSVRRALDHVFSQSTAEDMLATLAAIENGSQDLSKIVRSGEENEVSKVKQWAKETREQIELRSPTSVKLSIKAIREGAKLNIEEVLAMDNRIAAACCSPSVHTDFRTGVTEFLIKKIKPEETKPTWSPATLAEVTPESLQKIFFSSPAPFKNPPVPAFKPLRGTKDRLNPLSAYKVHPYSIFGLPTEKRIEQVVKGEAKDSPDYAQTREEIVNKFVKESNGKVGVKEKVEEVLDRRTIVAEENTLKWL